MGSMQHETHTRLFCAPNMGDDGIRPDPINRMQVSHEQQCNKLAKIWDGKTYYARGAAMVWVPSPDILAPSVWTAGELGI